MITPSSAEIPLELIDLTREIHHKMQRLVNHPTIEVYPFSRLLKSCH
jgi:hypothetical protein